MLVFLMYNKQRLKCCLITISGRTSSSLYRDIFVCYGALRSRTIKSIVTWFGLVSLTYFELLAFCI